MKKNILALMMAAVLTMGMSVTAYAEETVPAQESYSITIGQIENATEKHTYEAYQIFKGDLLEKDGKKILSNIEWGDNIDIKDGVEYKGNTYGEKDAAKLAEALSKESDAEEFAKVIAEHIFGDPKATATEAEVGQGVTLSGLEDGYYFVKDKDESLDGAADSYSRYMIQIAGTDVTVTAKADVPSTEKKVKDINDTTGEGTDWQDSADYDIGDVIPFQFSSTIVANIDKYVDPYIYTFHDVESAGLTFNENSVSMTVGGEEYTDFTVVTNPTDGCTFEVVTGDLKGVAKAGDKIVVEYTSTLNENAVIGATGNTNKMHLEYSNNPNGEGTGETPEDTVIAFTYKVVVNKVSDTVVDGKNQPLVGAEFTLEKKLEDGTWKAIDCIELTEENADPTAIFTFEGIDDGEYRLQETKTPEGYNTISDEYVYFTVTADHTVLSDSPQLVSLNGNTATGLVGTYTFAATEKMDELATTIENKSGSLLPSTGGMGTTIFYVLGGILVIGAGVVLFTRKRMSVEE